MKNSHRTKRPKKENVTESQLQPGFSCFLSVSCFATLTLMSFQTLPLPPALHHFLSSFTWPAPPPYSPAPRQRSTPQFIYQSISLSSLPDCLVCFPCYPAFFHPDSDLACLCFDLPFWITDLPFACSHWICLPRDWPAFLDYGPSLCLCPLDLFATQLLPGLTSAGY